MPVYLPYIFTVVEFAAYFSVFIQREGAAFQSENAGASHFKDPMHLQQVHDCICLFFFPDYSDCEGRWSYVYDRSPEDIADLDNLVALLTALCAYLDKD